MSKYDKEFKSLCCFCMSDKFELPTKNYQPQPGELIRCANCGRLNDVTSLIQSVEEEVSEYTHDVAKDVVDNALKDMKKKFKGNKFITFK